VAAESFRLRYSAPAAFLRWFARTAPVGHRTGPVKRPVWLTGRDGAGLLCFTLRPSVDSRIPEAGVRATTTTRKPLLLLRLSGVFLLRFAERQFLGLLFQEPPRNTRAILLRPRFRPPTTAARKTLLFPSHQTCVRLWLDGFAASAAPPPAYHATDFVHGSCLVLVGVQV
jgi:hypothetical protein